MEKDALTHELRAASGSSVEYLNALDIQEVEPALAPIFEAGYLIPENGHCKDPLGMAQALVKMFLNKGGRLVKTEVLDFVFDANGISGLLTSGGALNTRRVVIAAGIWSKTLCAKLGWRIPLESHRGYHATLEDPQVAIQRMCFPVDYKFAVTPMTMGLRIAGTVELAGLDALPNYERARKMVEISQILFPGLRTEKYTQWMGHRPCLPDSLPVIGPSPDHRGVYFAFGHGHQGLVGASQTGKVIDEIIRGVVPSMDMKPFKIDRF
jgi:D-amino-acid dehydrogenase